MMGPEKGQFFFFFPFFTYTGDGVQTKRIHLTLSIKTVMKQSAVSFRQKPMVNNAHSHAFTHTSICPPVKFRRILLSNECKKTEAEQLEREKEQESQKTLRLFLCLLL